MRSESVFLLWHTHHLSDKDDDDKLLGVYSCLEKVRQAEKRLGQLPGFCLPDGEFIIDEYRIDEDNWTEGFVTVHTRDA